MTPPHRDELADQPAGTLPGRVASRVRRRARQRLDGARAAADARWGRPRDESRPIYLVAPAGHPNHGDEQLLAGWLRYLRHRLPGTPVVVDCHTPGQAAVLHHAEHPDVLFTDTLWRLAGEHTDAAGAIDFCRRAVADLGVRPAVASGIDLLRGASVVHLIGGGYVNDLWPHHLGVAAGAGEAGRLSGARVVATGQGLLPCGDVDQLTGALRDFSLVTVRDAASHELLAGSGVPARLVGDDGWLALSEAGGFRPEDHPVYSPNPDTCRDLVVCVQSDLGDPDALAEALARLLVEQDVPGERITVVESIPGGDRVVWDLVCARALAVAGGGGSEDQNDDDDEMGRALAELDLPAARFVPFQELWAEGLPARPGQVWLTTRFHAHLFAAARGASGVALRLGSEYYDVKHGSLAAAGSPWALADVHELAGSAGSAGTAGARAGAAAPPNSSSGGFDPATVSSMISAMEGLAGELYPA